MGTSVPRCAVRFERDDDDRNEGVVDDPVRGATQDRATKSGVVRTPDHDEIGLAIVGEP